MASSEANPPDISRVASEILAYLKSHPGARDSLEGIAEWWLLERRILQEMQDVKKALGELVTKGLIEEMPAGDSLQYRMRKADADSRSDPPT